MLYKNKVYHSLIIFILFISNTIWSKPTSLLIKNVKIIDVKTGEILANKSIHINDNKITRISSDKIEGDFSKIIDAKNKYALPGLIDGHVHLIDIPGFRKDHALKHPKILDDYTKQLPRSYLYYGFTTLIDLNVTNRDYIDSFKKSPQAPDVFDCDNALTLANGYPMSFLPKDIRFALSPNFIYDDRQKDDIPKKYKSEEHTPEVVVEKAISNGAVCIKSFHEKGFIKDQPELPTMTAKMMNTIRQQADKYKVPLLIHANSFKAQEFSVKNGASILAHGMWHWDLNNENEISMPPKVKVLLDKISIEQIGYMPTVQVVYGSQALFDPNYLNQDKLKNVVPKSLWDWYQSDESSWFKKILQKNIGLNDMEAYSAFEPLGGRTKKVLKYLSSHNANLLFGSDTPAEPNYGNYPGFNGYRELQQWASAGVPLLNILQAATISNAKAFGLEKNYGTIEDGKIANILLMNENPLETIEALDSIETVILRGEVVNRSSLSAS